VRARRRAGAGRRRATVAAATLAAAGALAVIAVDRHVELGVSGAAAGALPAIAVDLALLTLVLLLARLALALRENGVLLARSRAEALTDALTGLGNRRALMAALDEALAGARAGR
jgi:PleD family two-component response regulator